MDGTPLNDAARKVLTLRGAPDAAHVGEPAAWMTEDGERVVTAKTKRQNDIGAGAHAMKAYTRPLFGTPTGVAADESRGQPTLREDAMYAMGYQRGAKDGWNFCISDDQDGFARTQASTEHVRVLRDTRAADESTRAPDAEFELHCDGEFAAGASGPRDRAWQEIQHYARQYENDGPCEIYEVTRRLIAPPSGERTSAPAPRSWWPHQCDKEPLGVPRGRACPHCGATEGAPAQEGEKR